MGSLEYHREKLHYFKHNTPEELVLLLPQNICRIEGKYDLSAASVGLECACASLELFILENFIGPSIQDKLPAWAADQIDNFELDGEHASPLAKCLPLLLFSRDCFELLLEGVEDDVVRVALHWWRWRCAQVMQRIIGTDRVPTLLKIFETSFESLKNSELIQERSTNMLFMLEAIQAALEYYQYDVAIACCEKVQTIYGKKFSLSGALGKRTKFQQFTIAQLYLKVETINNETEQGVYDVPHANANDISDILLDDDQLLTGTKFDDEEIKGSGNTYIVS